MIRWLQFVLFRFSGDENRKLIRQNKKKFERFERARTKVLNDIDQLFEGKSCDDK